VAAGRSGSLSSAFFRPPDPAGPLLPFPLFRTLAQVFDPAAAQFPRLGAQPHPPGPLAQVGEDGSRPAAAYQAFAAIRNAVTGAFRLLLVPGIAAQLRASLPLQLPGLAALPPSPA
jgi:hypothetical protein